MSKKPRLPSENEQELVDTVRVRPIRAAERARCMRLLTRHHYLGALQPVGEQVLYVAVGPNGGWRAVVVFCAAAKHLRYRDQWIGWTTEQRRRRLALVANNARFLILPGFGVPNMATRVLRLGAFHDRRTGKNKKYTMEDIAPSVTPGRIVPTHRHLLAFGAFFASFPPFRPQLRLSPLCPRGRGSSLTRPLTALAHMLRSLHPPLTLPFPSPRRHNENSCSAPGRP